jgi:O-antigen ligase
MIKDKPVGGIGIGMYKVKFFEYRDKVLDKIPYFGVYEKAEQAHNEYLQLWAEVGTIGIIAVMWLIISYFIYAIKLAIPRSSTAGLLYIPSPLEREGRVSGTTNQLLIIGCMSGVVAILIDAIGSFPFHIAPSAVLSVVLIALTVSLTISSSIERGLSLPSSSPLAGEGRVRGRRR